MRTKRNPQPYDTAAAMEAHTYVAKTFGNLSAGAFAVYSVLPIIESDRYGFGSRCIVEQRELAELAHISKNVVKDKLLELLRTGLLKVKIPERCVRGEATEICRVPLAELKARTLAGDSPQARLGRELQERGVWCDGRIVLPQWSLTKTLRLTTSKPNLQSIPRETRYDLLLAGSEPGALLVSCDIKSADPTVLKHLLKMPRDFDPYAIISRCLGCDRNAAKKPGNSLAYVRDSAGYFASMPDAVQAESAMRQYVERLDTAKATLTQDAKKRRAVRSLAGNCIPVETRTRPHGGKLLSWVVQATVSDIISEAALKVLERSDVLSLLPLHDELVVLFRPGLDAGEGCALVKKAIEFSGSRVGISVSVQASGQVQAP